VAQEIKKIDKEMVDVDKKIAEYCKELGIDLPF
jgi:type I restriction-modification system DNA methylase subunit